jgi:pristinamycin I synthase-3/4
MIEHGPTVNHIAALIRDYRVGAADAVLQLPSLSFQASVRDILGTVAAGAWLVLLDEQGARDSLEMVRAIAHHRVSCVLSIVPSLLRAVLDDPRTGRCRERGCG